MSKANILFIINPISGGKNKFKLPSLIDSCLDKNKFNANFSFTEYVGHATEIAEEAANKNFDIIVAVGGDGTVNEVAPTIMRLNKILGIVPFGSGNGLARSVHIPMDTKKAIQIINAFKIQVIDAAKLNERCFFNMAGMGFDAHISSVFAGNKGRGLKGYLAMFLKEMNSYEPQSYRLEVDGKVFKRDAYVISVANSSQYGNNVHISPKSSLTDGVLDLCIVKPFPLYKLPVLAYQMFSKITHKHDMVEIIKGKRIKIIRQKEDSIHLDGEPFFMGKNIEINVIPDALKIIIK